MLIKGFENAPLTEGEDLLALPGFWAAYLMWLSRTEEYDPVPEWFGVDGADVDAACDALSDEDRWPVFRIPFAGDHTAVVLGYNLPDDPGTEYFITHPEWGRHGHLATVGGHQAGPGLSWRELTHIARTPDLNAPGVHAEYARLLLLLPALGDQGHARGCRRHTRRRAGAGGRPGHAGPRGSAPCGPPLVGAG